MADDQGDEMRVWTPYPYLGESEGSAVFGDRGSLVIGNRGWRAYDAKGKLVKEVAGGADATPHVRNWVDCIRSREKPHCDLETVGRLAHYREALLRGMRGEGAY